MRSAPFLGRTGFGTILLAVVTAVLLAGAPMLPKDISTDWVRQDWRPAAVAAVQPRYELGTGDGTLDLSGGAGPAGRDGAAPGWRSGRAGRPSSSRRA